VSSKDDEIARLKFHEARDGLEGALAFAKQTYFVYRKNLAIRNAGGFRCGYSLTYRRPLVESCVILRQYIKGVRYE
jgi:hypothetical protein